MHCCGRRARRPRAGRVGERGHLPAPGTRRVADRAVEAGRRAAARACWRRAGRAAGVEHLGQAYQLQDDPRVRAEIAIVAASTHVFASPPGVATAFAREAAAALPEALADQRQALIALQRISGFMHGLDHGWRTPAPSRTARGPVPGCWPPRSPSEAMLDGTDRERAIEMARFALDGDQLLAVDDGLFWVSATAVRMIADDDLGDFWSRARAASHARGSLFATLSTSLWEGFWQWRRGELHEALACLRAALEQDRMWGGTHVGEPFASAFQIGCHLDRGDLDAARQVADGIAGPPYGEGGRVYQQAVARLLVAEGRCEAALAALDAAPEEIIVANPAWNPWRAIKAARPARARPYVRRRSSSRRRRWGCCAAGARRASSAGACACWASCAVRRPRRPARGGRSPLADDRRGRPRPRAVRPRQPIAGRGRRGGDPAAAGGRSPGRGAGRRRGARPRLRGARAARSPVREAARRGARLSSTERQILAPDRRRPGRARGRAAAVRHTGDGPGRARRGPSTS